MPSARQSARSSPSSSRASRAAVSRGSSPRLIPPPGQLPLAPVAVGVAHEDHRVAVAHHALDPARLRPRDAPVQRAARRARRDRRRAAPARAARSVGIATRVRSARAAAAPPPAQSSSGSRADPPGARRPRPPPATIHVRRRRSGPSPMVSSTPTASSMSCEVGPELGDRHRRHLAADLGLGHRGRDGAESGDAEGEPDGRLVVHGAMPTRSGRSSRVVGHPCPRLVKGRPRSPKHPASPPYLSHRRVVLDVECADVKQYVAFLPGAKPSYCCSLGHRLGRSIR